MAAVLTEILDRRLRVGAFLYGVTRSAKGDWEMFSRYRPVNAAAKPDVFFPSPVAFELTHGDQVGILEQLLPVDVSSKGSRKKAPPSAPFYFIGFVHGKDPSETYWRRWAMVRRAATTARDSRRFPPASPQL